MQYADRGGIVSRKTRFFQRERPGVDKRPHIFYFYPQYFKKKKSKKRKEKQKQEKEKRRKTKARKEKRRRSKRDEERGKPT